MLVIETRHFFLIKKKEIWFYQGEPLAEGTYTVYSYTGEHFPFKRTFEVTTTEQTLTIDLGATEAEIFKNISRTFRYHIHKAERYGITFEGNASPGLKECGELASSFRAFATQKGIKSPNEKRLVALQESGNLFITWAKKDNETLITHAYLGDKNHVVLLYSFHLNDHVPAAERSYANKFLHWQDILFFKKLNFSTYDLGGVNAETVPGITHFKHGFGGQLQTIHNYIRVAPWIRPFFRMYKKITN